MFPWKRPFLWLLHLGCAVMPCLELCCLGKCRGRGVMWEDSTAAVSAPATREQTSLERVGWKFSLKCPAESVALCFVQLLGPLCSLILDCPQCRVLKVKTRLRVYFPVSDTGKTLRVNRKVIGY